jgi:thiamine pyrophosphokinase
MKIIIISNGISPSLNLLKNELLNSKTIICADGGANCLYKFYTKNNFKILPNFLVGDLDSISKEAINFFKDQNVIFEQHSKEKDKTDTELALKKAIELGATEIAFLGCLGNRIDHLLGNLGILLQCLEININAILKDDACEISLLDKPATITGKNGAIFSLQAYYENVTNLNLNGSKYELKNYNLKIGDNLTLSNEFLDKDVKINFAKGKILVIIQK